MASSVVLSDSKFVARFTSGAEKAAPAMDTTARMGRITVAKAPARFRASSSPWFASRETRSGMKMDDKSPPMKSS